MYKNTLEKIFSIKGTRSHKIMTILGLEIKYRPLKRKLTYPWETGCPAEEFIRMYDSLFFFSRMRLPREITLIECVALLEAGERDKALSLLSSYIKKHGYKDVASYMPLAELYCKSQNANQADLTESAKAYDRLKDSRSKGLLKDLISGKSVAIVGNGPSEVGLGLGAEIESHDVVIRFNNFKVDGFEADYGCRTDIWVKCQRNDVVHRKLKDVSLILYEPDWDRTPIFEEYIKVILSDDAPADFFRTEEHSHLYAALKSSPSTGLVLIDNIFKYNPREVDVYGFQFLQEIQDGVCSHYFKDRNKSKDMRIGGMHNLGRESEYITSFLLDKFGESTKKRVASTAQR